MINKHIYPFGIVGNCSYISYIKDNSNIVWQCWPQFDSSFVFGGLIDDEKGGEFSVVPVGKYKSSQFYIEDTNILVTEFETDRGSYQVHDFAPRYENNGEIETPTVFCRKIVHLEGQPHIKVKCLPKAEYGEADLKLDKDLFLESSITIDREVILTRDEYIILSWKEKNIFTIEELYDKTKRHWECWIAKAKLPSNYQKEVKRSALVLKLHQFEKTGAIIASGTTSLPEHPGEERNWDYRYCWIRDAYFTLDALVSLGYTDELKRFSKFVEKVYKVDTGPYTQPLYTIDGEAEIVEEILPLKGYLGNGPVRVGNSAYFQIQHDVYGQMLLSLDPDNLDEHMIESILDQMLKFSDDADAGIWEFRGKKQKHAESFLFHWLGANFCLEHFQDNKTIIDKASKAKERASQNIEGCYDMAIQGYGMSHENKKLNAAEFLLLTLGYLNPESEKTIKHIKALEAELATDDNLVYRYRDADDFGETHSSFLVCAFWHAESLAMIGDIENAKRIYEDLLQRANSVGLLSEDIEPKSGSQWGNIPQTYSHAGVIKTAIKLHLC